MLLILPNEMDSKIILFRAIKNRKSWRAIIVHFLKVHRRKKFFIIVIMEMTFQVLIILAVMEIY